MTTVASTFVATGVSGTLGVRAGSAITIAISNTWVGTLILEITQDGGASWAPLLTRTSNVSLTISDLYGGGVRLRCSAYTSGTVTYTFSNVAEVEQEFENSMGDVVLAITETGITTPDLVVTETASVAGTLDVAGVATFTDLLWSTDATITGVDVLDASVSAGFGTDPKITAAADATVAVQGFMLGYGANTSGAQLYFGKTRSVLTDADDIVASGDQVMLLQAVAADGVGYRPAGNISIEVDGTPGANDMPGRIVFRTCADGSITPTERLRISQAGIITIPGVTAITNATASTSTITGALVVTGGVGIGGALFGTTASLSGITAITNATASTTTTTGALVVTGGMGIAGAINMGGNLTLNNDQEIGLKDNSNTSRSFAFRFSSDDATYIRSNSLVFGVNDRTSLATALTIATTKEATFAGAVTIGGLTTIADAQDIAVNATTGTKIGTATSQKLGFWNATPVIQPAGATQAAPAAYATGIFGLDSDANMHALYDLVVAIRTALVNCGIIKGSA